MVECYGMAEGGAEEDGGLSCSLASALLSPVPHAKKYNKTNNEKEGMERERKSIPFESFPSQGFDEEGMA